jgi:hypothetical protein
MFEIDYLVFFGVTALNIVLYQLYARVLLRGVERVFLAVAMVGLWFYSGIGSAFVPVAAGYLVRYCCFTALFGATFVFVVVRLRHAFRRRQEVYRVVAGLSAGHGARWLIISAYLLLVCAPLLYPEFRLSQLWDPQKPSLAPLFNYGFSPELDVVLRIADYCRRLVWPFYLLVLYRYRTRYTRLAVLIFLPLYVKYCADQYLGRAEVLVALLLFAGIIWLNRPRLRPWMAIAAAVLTPVLAYMAAIYADLRMGRTDAAAAGIVEAIERELYVETSFGLRWERVISAGRTANAGDYFKWLATLPIPKLLTGEIPGSRINYEIAEIITGVSRGSAGFWVPLTGPVNEAVYIYGPNSFWLHSVFIGVVAGSLCAFAAASPYFLTVAVHFTLMIGYVFARAGVGSLMPIVINDYLSLYILFIVLCGYSSRSASARTSSVRRQVGASSWAV